jgi:hypothetical protein
LPLHFRDGQATGPTDRLTHTHAHTHTYTHTYTHTDENACLQMRKHTNAHTHTHTCTHVFTTALPSQHPAAGFVLVRWWSSKYPEEYEQVGKSYIFRLLICLSGQFIFMHISNTLFVYPYDLMPGTLNNLFVLRPCDQPVQWHAHVFSIFLV